MRRVFIEAWRKKRSGEPLEPMEDMIAAVVAAHPAYHRFLEQVDALEKEFGIDDGETNPFLHMSMHIAIREQVSTDRPAGIRAIYQDLLAGFPDSHTLEHALMDCLGASLWEAQRAGIAPDEAGYLECVREIRRRRFGR
jgi:hypothetical protein